MKTNFPSLIHGCSPNPETLEVTSPGNGETIGSIEVADEGAIETALETMRRLFRDRTRRLDIPARLEILKKSADLLEARAEEFALGAALEGGKPLMDSRVEVTRAIDGIRNCAEVLRTQHGEEIPMGLNAASQGRLAFTTHEPIGPVLAYSAFNHPVNLIVHQVVPAIATGCPFLVKPAADTPLSCFRLVELFHEAGLPPAHGQAMVVKERELLGKAVADPRIAFFSFIGSGAVGWKLRGSLAPGTRCALEHGGVAPVIVAADADLAAAVPLLLKGGFYHAGQVCVSVQRIFARRSIAEDLATQLAAGAKNLIVGDAADPKTEVGPLIRPKETDRIAQWVGQAVAAGARALSGAEKTDSAYYAPTVLFDPPRDARISREEIFGPVVCVYPFDDLDATLAEANSLPFAFQASVFSRSIDTLLHCYRRLDASAVMANDHTAFRVDWMPFAGLRESGLGTGGIPHTMEDMQIRKLLVLKSPSLDARS